MLSCSAQSSDSDGDSLTESISWSVGGQSIGSGASLTLSPAQLSPNDSLTCTVTVSDPYGASASDSASLSITNQDPVIDSLSLSPAAINNQGTIECAAIVSDPDSETPALSYSWSNDSTGAVLGSGSTLTLTPALASSQDLVSCSVSAVDGYGGSASASISFTVENTAPVLCLGRCGCPNCWGDHLEHSELQRGGSGYRW